MLEIVKAFIEKQPLEMRFKERQDGNNTWFPCIHEAPNFLDYEYRVIKSQIRVGKMRDFVTDNIYLIIVDDIAAANQLETELNFIIWDTPWISMEKHVQNSSNVRLYGQKIEKLIKVVV